MFSMYSQALVVALAAILQGAMADPTPITDAQMVTYLGNKAVDLAYAYAPIWFFSQMDGNLPCYPTWAYGGSPTTADQYDTAHLTPPGAQCQYPNVGCNCRNPGVATGNEGPPFPIYYTFSPCGNSEVRVVYNVFYQKDGAKVGVIATGHDYDWERIIIVFSRNAATSLWTPTTAHYSAHSGYNSYAWANIQNTLTTEQAEAGLGPTPNGVQNLDHPKAYVGWSKHPHFDDRNTGFIDPVSQSLDNAYRGQDWWKFPEKEHYVLADNTTAAGKAMLTVNWGGATSDPPLVQNTICTEGS